MANFVYTEAKRRMLAPISGGGGIGTDIRVMLVGTSTTADTEEDVTTISGFGTLDEFSGGSYARQALTGEAVAADNANNRGEFDANNATFTAIDVDSAQAAVVYCHVTNDADSYPLAYFDDSPFPVTGNGGDLTINWNAEGILQTT